MLVSTHPTYGPDDKRTTCTQCGSWPAAGTGFLGRARVASSVTGPAQATVVYTPFNAYTGTYRVRAWVPALGSTVLGTATYTIAGKAVTIDQNAAKNAWRSLGNHTLSPGQQVVLGDNAPTAGQRIVADAVEVTAVPTMPFGAADPYVTYGEPASLWSYGLHHGGVGYGADDWRATLYKRRSAGRRGRPSARCR